MIIKRYKIKTEYYKRIILLISFLSVLSSCSNHTSKQENTDFQRIVSLAPSITETLFALGLGDKVVGVTNYCHYPPCVDSIEKVGGYSDANLEKIIMLNPDVVVLQKEHEKHRFFLTRNGIKTITVDYKTIADICSSFVIIGKACNRKKEADSLVGCFSSMFRKDTVENNFSPKVLVCVGREGIGNGKINGVFVAGAGTFYNDLIHASLGENVFVEDSPQYPKLSLEGIITLSPDIIIDILSGNGNNCKEIINDWKFMPNIPAVKNNRIYCINSDYATIPGPRIIKLFDDFKKIIEKAK